MARPRINPKARSIPISFSVKPSLAEKIDEYSHQQRFSRSKFLAQAVNEAINKIELGAHIDDRDYRNFSDDRIAMIAKVRLDEAEEMNPTVLRQLKDSIKAYEDRQKSPTNTPSEASNPKETFRITGEDLTPVYEIKWEKVGSTYRGSIDGKNVTAIKKQSSRKWIAMIASQSVSYPTLKEAKADAEAFYRSRGA